jgi:hypothetical protein
LIIANFLLIKSQKVFSRHEYRDLKNTKSKIKYKDVKTKIKTKEKDVKRIEKIKNKRGC